MAVRITDVAKEAGVSPATVSYVLSGKRPISVETKQRVLRVIERLGYVPDADARALKSRRSQTLGLIAYDFVEESVSRMIMGVEKVASKFHYHTFFVSSQEFNYDVAAAVAFLSQRNLGGLIILFGVSSDLEIPGIPGLSSPLVSVNQPVAGPHPCIMPDNYDGGHKAAQHLIEAGCRNLAVIAGPRIRFASEERLKGFRDGLAEKEISCGVGCVYYGDFDYSSGETGLRYLLKHNPDLDGVFCANDRMAAGAINAATQMGLRVPERLKVLGFDNLSFTSFWPIPISTFALPYERMGSLSATTLFSMINNEDNDPSTIFLASPLIPRRSTGY